MVSVTSICDNNALYFILETCDITVHFNVYMYYTVVKKNIYYKSANKYITVHYFQKAETKT